jgi:hypothetical protein
MRVIRFDTVVYSPQYGAFAAGDLLRCGEAFATHCVANLKAAKYVDAALSPPLVVIPEAAAVARPARRTKTRLSS